jgi:hypothetical protein
MGNPTSATTENPEPRRLSKDGARESPMAAATEDIDAACSDERPSRGPWPSEAPTTGGQTEVLGELAFYYGACWLHYRSAQRRRKER